MARHALEREQIYSLPKSIFDLIDKAVSPDEAPFAMMALLRLFFEGIEPDLDEFSPLAGVVIGSIVGRVRASRNVSIAKAKTKKTAEEVPNEVCQEMGNEIAREGEREREKEKEGVLEKDTPPRARAKRAASVGSVLEIPEESVIKAFVAEYVAAQGIEEVDPGSMAQRFCATYTASGWIDANGNPVADWRALARKWVLNEHDRPAAKRWQRDKKKQSQSRGRKAQTHERSDERKAADEKPGLGGWTSADDLIASSTD